MRHRNENVQAKVCEQRLLPQIRTEKSVETAPADTEIYREMLERALADTEIYREKCCDSTCQHTEMYREVWRRRLVTQRDLRERV